MGGERVKTDIGEIRAASFILAVVMLYMALVLGSGLIPVDQFAGLVTIYIKSLGSLGIVAAALSLIGLCVVRGVRERAAPPPFPIIRQFIAGRWQRDRMLSVIAPIVVCTVTLASFNAFKQLVLPAAGFHFDPLFADLDRALFLGNDPWMVSHAVFGSNAATRFIDTAYHGWFVPMTLGIIVCAFLAGRAELRFQYVASYAFSWIIIGSVLAFLLPAAGPCFYGDFAGSTTRFAPLMRALAEVNAAVVADGDGGLSALRNQQLLIGHFGSGKLALGGGISAMPSMHIALAMLFALGAWRLSRPFGVFMWGYAVLIWIGSIHLGWHYAIDGLVSALLAVAIWKATGYIGRALLYGRTSRSVSVAVPAE